VKARLGSGPVLRLVGRRGSHAPLLGEDEPIRLPRKDWTIEDYGHPSCQFRVMDIPLEVRIWRSPPPPGVQAVLHPSGVWLALRTV
jgi:hypothetical protein